MRRRATRSPVEFHPYDPLSTMGRHKIPPLPGKRNGKWLTGDEINHIIERFGPMYVSVVRPEWAQTNPDG